MRTGNMSWQSLDYLKMVERAAFHRLIGFKVFCTTMKIKIQVPDWEIPFRRNYPSCAAVYLDLLWRWTFMISLCQKRHVVADGEVKVIFLSNYLVSYTIKNEKVLLLKFLKQQSSFLNEILRNNSVSLASRPKQLA